MSRTVVRLRRQMFRGHLGLIGRQGFSLRDSQVSIIVHKLLRQSVISLLVYVTGSVQLLLSNAFLLDDFHETLLQYPAI